jgi:hypothetical protein
MTAASLEPLPVTGDERQASLTRAVAALRVRSSRSADQWLLIIGGVLFPLGALLILLGWWGASHTPRVFEQIPYMISGGILGLALVVAGGFLYFAYWLTTIVRDQRQHTERMVESLVRIEHLLAGDAVAASVHAVGEVAEFAPPPAPAAVPPPAAAKARSEVDGDLFVATAKGSQYHRPECPVVAGRDGLRQVRADEAGMKPCRICEPDT